MPVPSIPIEMHTLLPPPPPVIQPPSPKRERQPSSTITTEPEHSKPPISTTPIPIRQCSEAGTQTIQVR